ncbi:hypothetical protein AQUCO_01700026v1 [Aquilegia coerulea]|uniref:Uncharacterized protein n=1 Tax=Aquilegia coerulea TaxID=218851 RepID=A0A2G5DKU8_AQUCA|nr:hypothetical protein AQUCO_01700026v1 [Aquilegia coerulea]
MSSSSSSLRSGTKRCFNRLLFNNRSILFQQQHVSSQAAAAAAAATTSLTKHQLLSRHYTRSPLHFYRNFFKDKSKFRSQSSFSSSYRSYCSSSSSSSKNGFIGWYLGMIEARPVLTKSVTSALIYTFADLSSQAITRKSEDSFDLVRTLRMAGYGMLVMGPSLHFWFNFVSRVLPKRDVLNTLKKIFIGQTTYGPLMTTVFFSVNAGLQGTMFLT